MIKTIKDKNKIFAKLISVDGEINSSEFFSDINDSIQIGILSKETNHKTGAHYHPKTDAETTQVDEILVVQKGSIRIDIYNEVGAYIKSFIAKQNNIVIIYHCGHNIVYQQDSKILTIKNGPYIQDENKIRIIGSNNLEIVTEEI